MRLAAVESANNLLLQPVSLRRIFRLHHALGELTQLLRAELTGLSRWSGKLDYPGLFLFRQAFYLFDDFNRSHAFRLLVMALTRKWANESWRMKAGYAAPFKLESLGHSEQIEPL